jgi:hypothetical protein
VLDGAVTAAVAVGLVVVDEVVRPVRRVVHRSGAPFPGGEEDERPTRGEAVIPLPCRVPGRRRYRNGGADNAEPNSPAHPPDAHSDADQPECVLVLPPAARGPAVAVSVRAAAPLRAPAPGLGSAHRPVGVVMRAPRDRTSDVRGGG